MPADPNVVLGLDVGAQRIGVASASLAASLPHALTTLTNNDSLFSSLGSLIDSEGAEALVVGLPRGLEGQSTEQTRFAETFADELKAHYDLPVYLQDEAVTSKQAEAELRSRGKPYRREDIDALSAVYILEDWLAGRKKAVA